MQKPRDITIYDIARTLDVSPSTVSRALNDDPAVSKKTRKKVYDTAAKMGYRSNQFARSLRQQQSLIIGVLVFELSSEKMTSILSGIEKAATGAGYGVIIMDSAQSIDKEISNARALFLRRVDGVIVFPSPASDSPEHFRPFREKNIPIIFLDRSDTLPNCTSVVIDNEKCGYMATRHLIEQGCRRIAHITAAAGDVRARLRYNGYRSALAEAGLSFEEELAIVAAPAEQDGVKAAGKFMDLSPMPDGLFASDDLTAAVCIRTLLDQGVRVPQDVAVVGFNNDFISKLIRPALTTIDYPGREIGETAADMLIRQLKDVTGTGHITLVTVRAELIIRQSSLK